VIKLFLLRPASCWRTQRKLEKRWCNSEPRPCLGSTIYCYKW